MRRPPAIPRDDPGGRSSQRLHMEALENDLRAAVRLGAHGIAIGTSTNPTGGSGPPAGASTYRPHHNVVLAAQNEGSDENIDNMSFEVLDFFTEARILIYQLNSGGGTYYAEFRSSDTGGVWTNLGDVIDVDLTTGGTGSGVYVGGWTVIKSAVRNASGVEVRLTQSGGGASTDIGLAVIQFRGPYVQAEPGSAASEIAVTDDDVDVTDALLTLELGKCISVAEIVSAGRVAIESWVPVGNGDWEAPDLLYEDGQPLMHTPL